MTKRVVNTIDKYVAKRIKMRRKMMGISQRELGHRLGVIPQQISKYERGINRIKASDLYTISKILNVGLDFFFEGLPTIGESL